MTEKETLYYLLGKLESSKGGLTQEEVDGLLDIIRLGLSLPNSAKLPIIGTPYTQPIGQPYIPYTTPSTPYNPPYIVTGDISHRTAINLYRMEEGQTKNTLEDYTTNLKSPNVLDIYHDDKKDQDDNLIGWARVALKSVEQWKNRTLESTPFIENKCQSSQ